VLIEVITERDALKKSYTAMKRECWEWKHNHTNLAKLNRALVARLRATQPIITSPDDWLPWNGGEQPVPDGTMVECRLRGNSDNVDLAEDFDWRDNADIYDIVFYRVVKPAETKPDAAPPILTSPDDWLPWNGGEQPVPDGTLVEYRMPGRGLIYGPVGAEEMRWGDRISAYRVVKPVDAAPTPPEGIVPAPVPTPDPYAALKAAHAAGRVIEYSFGGMAWTPLREDPLFVDPVERYRIAPETPAPRVPLGPEDIAPGSHVRRKVRRPLDSVWLAVTRVGSGGIWAPDGTYSWVELAAGYELLLPGFNPETGWRECSKEGGATASHCPRSMDTHTVINDPADHHGHT